MSGGEEEEVVEVEMGVLEISMEGYGRSTCSAFGRSGVAIGAM